MYQLIAADPFAVYRLPGDLHRANRSEWPRLLRTPPPYWLAGVGFFGGKGAAALWSRDGIEEGWHWSRHARDTGSTPGRRPRTPARRRSGVSQRLRERGAPVFRPDDVFSVIGLCGSRSSLWKVLSGQIREHRYRAIYVWRLIPSHLMFNSKSANKSWKITRMSCDAQTLSMSKCWKCERSFTLVNMHTTAHVLKIVDFNKYFTLAITPNTILYWPKI